jgi:hypothetical protein
MRIMKYLPSLAYAVFIGCVVSAGSVPAQETSRGDLPGRWELNAQLSENAYQKLEAMHSPSSAQGVRRHMGGLFGGGPDPAQIEQARALFADPPASFALKTDDVRVTWTYDDGRVRTLTTDGRKHKVEGHDVRAWWDHARLVSETSLGDITITETYERAKGASQIIATSKMGMGGREVTVRRVYDAATPR